MLVPLILGLLLGFFLALFLVIRYQWNNAAARKDEIEWLLASATEETVAAEVEAVGQYYSTVFRSNRCAVCYSYTTTRCSGCKAVHYCSGKCQIVHWRHGHKHQCRRLASSVYFDEGSYLDEAAPFEHHPNVEDVERTRSSGGTSESPIDVSLIRKTAPSGQSLTVTSLVNNGKSNVERRKRKVVESHSLSECADYPSLPSEDHLIICPKTELASNVNMMLKSQQNVSNTGEQSFKGKNGRSLSTSTSCDHPSSLPIGSSSIRSKSGIPPVIIDTADMPQGTRAGFKLSVQKACQQFNSLKESKHHELGVGNEAAQRCNYKIIFPFQLFIKLYSDEVSLSPFGLINCGNSCYANAVLQCLTFTRPLASYFIRGYHSKACRKKEWCFICEFEGLIMKARGGESTLSPIRILSKIKRVTLGREEDAHEFLRYAVETMQSICLKEAGTQGKGAEETTLAGLTFAGFLRSKIKCMKCLGKFEQVEQIMDLTVEIDGNIRTLEEALAQFTVSETLDGENKYRCSRCRSYEKARKKLTILEAPNILTIVLKRFQVGNFGKLNKFIQFPEVLDMNPYMSGSSDKSHLFSLYAVVVHLDSLNTTFSGHYISYVKSFHGQWFRIDDSTVIPTVLERVLHEGAYMLLYARHSPRALSVERNLAVSRGVKLKKQNTEAIQISHNLSRKKSNSVAPSIDPFAQGKPLKYSYERPLECPNGNQMLDTDYWRFYSTHRFPASDSSSESSSLFSYSDASSCSTKDSSQGDDLSDYIFGEAKPSMYRRYL